MCDYIIIQSLQSTEILSVIHQMLCPTLVLTSEISLFPMTSSTSQRCTAAIRSYLGPDAPGNLASFGTISGRGCMQDQGFVL